jgi:hypothetical protein
MYAQRSIQPSSPSFSVYEKMNTKIEYGTYGKEEN